MVETPGRLVVNPELAATDAIDGEVLPAGVYPVGTDIPPDRVELFRVNGRIYTLAKHVKPQVLFRFMRNVRRSGNDVTGLTSMTNMMYEILGEPVMDALADEELSDEEMEQVMGAVQKYAMSAMDRSGLGNSPKGPAR